MDTLGGAYHYGVVFLYRKSRHHTASAFVLCDFCTLFLNEWSLPSAAISRFALQHQGSLTKILALSPVELENSPNRIPPKQSVFRLPRRIIRRFEDHTERFTFCYHYSIPKKFVNPPFSNSLTTCKKCKPNFTIICFFDSIGQDKGKIAETAVGKYRRTPAS